MREISAIIGVNKTQHVCFVVGRVSHLELK